MNLCEFGGRRWRSRVAGWCALMVGAVVVAGCSAVEERTPDFSPSSTVTRDEVLAIAEAYRRHSWTPSERNVFHGFDRQGIRVDTPDVSLGVADAIRPGWWKVGKENVGVPYQWGGFDTPRSFSRKVAKGYYAGDVYSEEKRALLYAAVSKQACGVDCSGFISRCWRLDRAYSTRDLPGLCDPLSGYEDLRPGDILNKHNVHALIFAGFTDRARRELMAYEAGSPPSWKVLAHPIPVAYLQGLGYEPFRYRGIRDE